MAVMDPADLTLLVGFAALLIFALGVWAGQRDRRARRPPDERDPADAARLMNPNHRRPK